MPTDSAKLTDRQAQILAFISKRQRTGGPKLEEVAAQFGITREGVRKIANILRAAGKLEPESGSGLVVKSSPSTSIRRPILRPNGKL